MSADRCGTCGGIGRVDDPDQPETGIDCWKCGGTQLAMPTDDDLTPHIERLVAPLLHAAVRHVIRDEIIRDRKRNPR